MWNANEGDSMVLNDELLITVSKVRSKRALLTVSKIDPDHAFQFIDLSHTWVAWDGMLKISNSATVRVHWTRIGRYSKSGPCHKALISYWGSSPEDRFIRYPVWIMCKKYSSDRALTETESKPVRTTLSTDKQASNY